MIKVLSPKYGDTLTDSCEIRIYAGNAKSVSAYCVREENKKAVDTELSKMLPDKSSICKLNFDPKVFPHGPITLRFKGGEGENRDICQLMLYNAVGKPYREGLDMAEKPIFSKGLELLFSDDFDGPLSISNSNDSLYYSHKPGGGDFSQLPFSDYESAKNPFSQRDTYLRIRADANINSSGLISSIKPDLKGFSCKAPCYFECRFLAPNAIGTWPAFWLMTLGVADGLQFPADELDTIEAYGIKDLTHQNQVGYYVTSHRWNQDKQETIDPDRFVDMRTIGDQTGWDHAFHTYGTLITEQDTVYTCDDIEVFRHPTQPISKTEPFFFMINLAVGGNGWPVDLSRYGGIADMYVDYVQVYGRK